MQRGAGEKLSVTVRSDHDQRIAEIVISDTGCGIPPDKLEQIFQPFYSTKTSDSQGQGGTGLGLSLCRDVIESHHGQVDVQSTVGEGTTFTLRFPLVDAPRLGSAFPSRSLTPAAG